MIWGWSRAPCVNNLPPPFSLGGRPLFEIYTRGRNNILANVRICHLKGQCHEIFDFWFFSWISFPQGRFKFFRWHRWQMEKIFNHESFNYFVWKPWEVKLAHRYIFAFKFTLRSQQPDIVPIICHRFRWYRWQFFRRCRWRWHRWQICHWSHWYRWCTLTFKKNLKRGGGDGILWGWRETDLWKNQKQKISWHCPFKRTCIAPVVWSFFIDYCTAIRDT
jgi:hypothetical protein